MKYRHVFHAGNFADVHKHVALVALLQAMQRKDKGFLYLDSHAGAGSYSLGAEAKRGIVALLAAPEPEAEELQQYRQLVSAWRATADHEHAYPGSALLAAQLLRHQDRGVCCEVSPRECRALERALGGFRRVSIHGDDGYRALAACLPCVERRGLILIDPPYEDPAEWELASATIAAVLARQANSVIVLWYPIKDERSLGPWKSRLQQQLQAPALTLELWLYPRDARVALNGSGLLIVNPPYQFEARAEPWQRELLAVLDGARLGGSSSRAWLPAHASPISA